MENLEKLYSPSQWTQRENLKVVDIHGDFMKTKTEKARVKIMSYTFKYNDGKETLLEMFNINSNCTNSLSEVKFEGKPVFVYIHGGYWQWGSVYWSGFMSENFANSNIITVALGYDIAPECKIEEMVSQIEQGVSIILSIAKKTNSKVFVCGHSAGAHLAAMLLYTDFMKKYGVSDECLSGFFLISGVYDLLPLVTTTINDCLKMNANSAKQLSPFYNEKVFLTHTTKEKMSILVSYAQYDSPAFKKQSGDFSEILKKKYNIKNVDLLQIGNKDHFEIIESLWTEESELSKALVDMMKS